MALSKTLHFDDDVLEQLREMRVEVRGEQYIAFITTGQLDRQLYERVNKALEALGGRWHRGVGGHVFSLDPREKLSHMVETASITVEKDGFFETPEEVANMMLETVPLPGDGGFILEPSAGMGKILDVLLRQKGIDGHTLYAIEKDEDRFRYLREHYGSKVWVFHADFLVTNAKLDYHPFIRIYANPPFEQGQDTDHVRHMYDCLADGGWLVSVMSTHFLFGQDSKAIAFREWFNSVPGHVKILPEGSFVKSGTGVNCLLAWMKKKKEEPKAPPAIAKFDL